MSNPADALSFPEVAEFVREFAGPEPATSITPQTWIEADLGVTGLDGDRLLQAAAIRFDCQLTGTDGYITTFGLAPDEYLFRSEGLDLLGIGALADRLLGRANHVVRDLTVGEFHRAICRTKQPQARRMG